MIRTWRTEAASGFAWLARRDDEPQQRYGEEEKRRQPRKDAGDTFAQVRLITLINLVDELAKGKALHKILRS